MQKYHRWNKYILAMMVDCIPATWLKKPLTQQYPSTPALIN